MKKSIILFSALALSLSIFSSCKKCSTCNVYDSFDNSLMYQGEQNCAPKKQIEEHQEFLNTTYACFKCTVIAFGDTNVYDGCGTREQIQEAIADYEDNSSATVTVNCTLSDAKVVCTEL